MFLLISRKVRYNFVILLRSVTSWFVAFYNKDHRDEIEVPDPLNVEDLISYNKIVNKEKQG